LFDIKIVLKRPAALLRFDLLPRLSQELLAEMVGTTRPRVNFFMNKFRKLGFIDYDGAGLRVHGSLLSIVLHE
jgi:CRP-like cAMP-binding protein